MPGEPVKTPSIAPLECEECHCTFTPKRRWKKPPRFHNDRCRARWHHRKKEQLLEEARGLLARVGAILEELVTGEA